jgi:hypothetical protein
MPKLLLFAPCERVILGQGDNSVSLIVLIQKLQLNQTQAPPFQENATVFARISLFAQWQRSPNDSDKVFEQKFTFGSAGTKPIVETVMEFQMSERILRAIGVLEAFPVVPAGDYEFSLWLREKETNWPVAPIAIWPIEVAHASNVVLQK